MNLMGTGMWAIGFSLVQQRAGKMLKLFIAAPMRRWQLLAAQVLARLIFLGLEAASARLRRRGARRADARLAGRRSPWSAVLGA